MYIADMRRLETALKYIQRMADGCNPVNNTPTDDSVINNPNVVRCLHFVKEILEEVKDNQGAIGGRAPKTPKEPFPFEVLKEFQYEADKPITHILRQFQSLTMRTDVEKLSYKPVTDWLKEQEYLIKGYSEEVKKETTMPTEKGRELGIYTEVRAADQPGAYLAVLYNRAAQEFLAENLEGIMRWKKEKDLEKEKRHENETD